MNENEQKGATTTQTDATTVPAASSSKVGFPAWMIGTAAIVLLVVYGFFTYTMMGIAGDNWDRILVLFQGVEALAFAAAGAIFGVQVQRGQVQQAETELKEEKRHVAVETKRISTDVKALENIIKNQKAKLAEYSKGQEATSSSIVLTDIDRAAPILENLNNSLNSLALR